MAAVIPTGNYVTTAFNLADTNKTTVYTVPTGFFAYVTQIWAADDAGAARTLTIEAGLGGTDYMLGYQVAIAINVPLDWEFKPLQMTATDTIKMTASAAGIHGFVSVHHVARRLAAV